MATKTDAPTFYEDAENLKKLCNFLLTGEGPRVREALLMEKRVLYLKGREYNMIHMIQSNVQFMEMKSEKNRISCFVSLPKIRPLPLSFHR
jgi:hypothetical protein